MNETKNINYTCQYDETLNHYTHDIKKIKLLNREEEVTLVHAAQSGNIDAKNKLALSNLRFVIYVAKKYRNQGVMFSDLIGEGNCGLLKAIDHYDAKRGTSFVFYAIWWIRQAIQKAIADQSRTIRLPLNRVYELSQMKKFKEDMLYHQQKRISYQNAAHSLKIRKNTMLDIFNTSQKPISLDETLKKNGTELQLIDITPNNNALEPDKELLSHTLKATIEKALHSLPKKHAEILRFRFGLNGNPPKTLRELGILYSLTKERIRQIEKHAIAILQRSRYKQLFRLYSGS